MSARIDAELDRIKKLGQTPKIIYVGNEIYLELDEEQNPSYAADILSPGQMASVHSHDDVTEYQGIKVVLLDNVLPDHLQIQT